MKIKLLCLLLLSTMFANAQQTEKPVNTAAVVRDNFTAFTPQKFYTDPVKLKAITPAKYTANPDFGKRFIGKHFRDSDKWYERIDKRTLKSRSYINANNPANILTEYGHENLNYIDENGWLRAVNTSLQPNANGWSAAQQEIPVYFYKDGSTALNLAQGQLMTFNKNAVFNGTAVAVSNYTVGDNGMVIKNVAPNTDKIMRVGRGSIETDYKINAPIQLSNNLVIGEDINLPNGYTIAEKINYDDAYDRAGGLVVKNKDGITVAELKAPFCYDSKRNSVAASYSFHQQQGGYRLTITVPQEWLNASARQYPVTIDPAVIGNLASWPIGNGIINSCLNSYGRDTAGNDTGTIIVAIPPKITVTDFYVDVACYAAADSSDSVTMWFSTGCIDSIYTLENGPHYGPPDYVYMFSDFIQDVVDSELNCFPPSCDTTYIPLEMSLVRMAGGSGCNANYFYYDPNNNNGVPYEAYVEGFTDETNYAGAGWSVSPNPTCNSNCTLTLNTVTVFGVPPYTITHPWADSAVTYGTYNNSSAVSMGTVNLLLNIPNCPGPACAASVLTIPAPVIVDGCGDTVQGLSALSINVRPSPDLVFTSVPNPDSVCSGKDVAITLTSCVVGTKYAWTGSDGSTGTASVINDGPVNYSDTSQVFTYTVTPTAPLGCAGASAQVSVVVGPSGVLDVEPQFPVICSGAGVMLYVNGGGTGFTWSPATGLSATTGDSVLANPTAQTTYTVVGKDSLGCASVGTDIVGVIPAPNKPTITISVTGDSLISSAGSYNQWYFNGVPLQDSTGPVLVIKGHARGWYEVTVTNPANGCTTTSDSTTSIDQLSAFSEQLSIYPNPTGGAVIIKINSLALNVNEWSLQLTDVLGRTLLTIPSLNYSNNLSLSNLPDGVYFITIINDNKRAVFPEIKQE